jgi:hypothetical protein
MDEIASKTEQSDADDSESDRGHDRAGREVTVMPTILFAVPIKKFDENIVWCRSPSTIPPQRLVESSTESDD